MPYLQLFTKGHHQAWWDKQISPGTDLNEVNARKELQALREQFPLQQSEGSFYRMNHDSVLFEQPEHMSLTLEQEVWLEERGYDTFYYQGIWQFEAEILQRMRLAVARGWRMLQTYYN